MPKRLILFLAVLASTLAFAQAAQANTLHCGKARWALHHAGRPAWGRCHRITTHIIRVRHYCVLLHHHPWWEFWRANVYDTYRCY